ncbi:hypothetical protein KI387_019858, partial [Taxus chinensis]
RRHLKDDLDLSGVNFNTPDGNDEAKEFVSWKSKHTLGGIEVEEVSDASKKDFKE